MSLSDDPSPIIRETLRRHWPDVTDREVQLLAASWEIQGRLRRRSWGLGWLVGCASAAAATLLMLWWQQR